MSTRPSRCRRRRSHPAWVCVGIFLVFAAVGFSFVWAEQKLENAGREHEVKIETGTDDWHDRVASLTSESIVGGFPAPPVRVG